MKMDKKIKTLIADEKLSDEDILAALTAFTAADAPDAEPDPDGEQGEDQEQTEEDSQNASTTEDSDDVEEDAATEQPDIQAMINEGIAQALADMRTGKKQPRIDKTAKMKTTTVRDFSREFGEIP